MLLIGSYKWFRMSVISKLNARQLYDSRGIPTIEVELMLKDGSVAKAAVPSGASTGAHEAVELRDNDKERFAGKGVNQAIYNVKDIIAKEIIGKQFDQQQLDITLCALDGTEDKSIIGANAILGVSLAFAKAQSIANKIPLYQHLSWQQPVMPTPFVNIINGGQHADNILAIQEFMIVPLGINSFADKLRAVAEIYQRLKNLLKSAGLSTNVGDEGGFAPNLQNSSQAIELILEAIAVAGYGTNQVQLAIDAAASTFYRDNLYHLDGLNLTSTELVAYYEMMVSKYPIISLEDPLAEDDWDGWQILNKSLGHFVQIVGDDIFTTNSKLLQRGIDNEVANAILIKPNQIGTLSETIKAMQLAEMNGYKPMVSHRSGETEDTFIAHLAVASGCGQIKTGAICRGERTAKYNELLRIAEAIDTA